MKQSEKECGPEPAPAPGSARPKDILKRDKDDAGRDERLNHPLRQGNEIERRQRQCDGVGNRKGCDDFDQVPKRRCCQNQRTDEQEMVVAGEDVVNAVIEKCLKQ
jgi:hypothetical protein